MDNNTLNPSIADIMVVDDTLANVQILSSMLKKRGYKVRPALNGRLALEAADKNPPDLILLDISMPEMDGFEVCRRIKNNSSTRDIPIIFISALSETLDKITAFSLGGVDYITKPFQLEEVLARVETHLEIRRLRSDLEKHNLYLANLVEEKVKEITESQMATIIALAKLAERRDDDTGKHLERVQSLCKLLAGHLYENQQKTEITPHFIENLYFASALHDIGKVGIQDNILLKPGKLTPEEFTIMKTHTTIGAQTLEAVLERYPKNSFITMGIEIARSHHEKWDGSGYPSGLKGQEIPLSARILTLVDVYDALRSRRVYKPPFDHETTKQIIYESSGSHFDPEIVEAFRGLNDTFRQIRDTLV